MRQLLRLSLLLLLLSCVQVESDSDSATKDGFNTRFSEIKTFEENELANHNIYFDFNINELDGGYNTSEKFSRDTKSNLREIYEDQAVIDDTLKYIEMTSSSTYSQLNGSLMFSNGIKKSVVANTLAEATKGINPDKPVVCFLINSNGSVKENTHLIEKDISANSTSFKSYNVYTEGVTLNVVEASYPDGYILQCYADRKYKIYVEDIQESLKGHFLVEKLK